MNKNGLLIVVVGPSGSGKGTVIKELLKKDDNTYLSISATTRDPRPGEVDGIHYLFTTKEAFQVLIDTKSMLEYATYCDNFYGTPKATVLNRIKNGQNVILEIEMQGAKQIKEMYNEALLLFLAPPSQTILRHRLVGRGTEKNDVVEKRLATAVKELSFSNECDYIVINNTVEQAVADIHTIIEANLFNKHIMKPFIDEMLSNE